MKSYKNINTGKVLNEVEYNELLIREYTDMYENDLTDIAEEFKEEGKTLCQFIEYMIENDIDNDFEEQE